VVDQLDLSAIMAVYEDEERGYPPYHPVMLTKVLVYAYCVGVFSSRKIQRRLVEDVAFRVLAAGNAPDFRTLADFRKTHLVTLKGFFEQVLRLAREMGRRESAGSPSTGARSKRTRRSIKP
jgi:transposase